ncbi:MAG: agmatinase family protein [Cyclobacteriaceae bacterium]
MYNPSDVGKKGSLFGLPYSLSESNLVLLPVNLDVTVSYAEGTSESPEMVLNESSQLDLSIPGIEKAWEMKMAMAERFISSADNNSYRNKARKIIGDLESGIPASENAELLSEVNAFCKSVHNQVEEQCNEWLDQGKMVGIVGGDHSSPLGLIRALSNRGEFSILQIDAHMDLRNTYEGFTFSHASIMHHALQCEGVKSLTQIGIRDYCEEEENYVECATKPIHIFQNEWLFEDAMNGATWKQQVERIIKTVSNDVYVSFDIDGLDPSLCPNTGTPVPGGLKFGEVVYLLSQLVKSGKKVVGFDLCEVGNAAWDANVGARILYRLAATMGVTQNLLRLH